MTFPVLAFFSRTMRVQARSWRTYIFRCVLALAMWALLAFSQASSVMSDAPGRELFGILIGANLIVLCTIAVVYFATAITEEKEEMTLGLLKLAGLNPISILLGKSTSRMLGLGTLLLVQVPFAILAVTLGGVSIPQVLAAYLMLLAFSWFLCNLARVCSVVCSRGRHPAARPVIRRLVFFLLPWAAKGIAMLLVEGYWNEEDLLIRAVNACSDGMIGASPFICMDEIMNLNFTGPVIGYQVIASAILGVCFFLLSWVLFNRCTRTQKGTAPARGLIPKSGVLRRPLGVGRPWGDALAWKEFHFMTGGKTKIIVKSIVFAVAVVVTIVFAYFVETGFGFARRSIDWDEICAISGGILMVGALVVTALEMGVYASRIFSSEVRWRTLSGLIGLPISVGRLAGSKVLGCSLTLVPNLVLFMVAAAIGYEPLGEVLETVLTEGEAFMVVCYLFSQFLLFLGLTAFLSLYVKWGAFVLAFLILFFGQYFIMMLAFVVSFGGGSDGMGAFLFMSVVSTGLAFLFAFLVTTRLTSLAGTQT